MDRSAVQWTAIAHFIRTHRERIGLTTDALSAATMLPREYIEQIETGAVFPSIPRWRALGAALGFNPADGIRVAAMSVPPLTTDDDLRVRAAIRARGVRHRVFIQERRDAAGLTIPELAVHTGISADDLEAIESGGDILPTRALQRIGVILGFTMEEYLSAVADDDCRSYGT